MKVLTNCRRRRSRSSHSRPSSRRTSSSCERRSTSWTSDGTDFPFNGNVTKTEIEI